VKTQEQKRIMGLPSVSKMNGKQRWAIGKLHRVTEGTSGVIIYFCFADLSESEEKDIDLGILPLLGIDNLSSKAQKKYVLKSFKKLCDLEVVKIIHSHTWRNHRVIIVPVDQLTAKLRNK
jgi:hypothetical protein